MPLWIGEFGLDTNANIASQVTRYETDPHLAGWSLWTWKSAVQSNGGRFPLELPVSPTFMKLAKYVASTANPKPTVAEAQQGMSDYLTAVQSPIVDLELIAALG